MMHKIKLYFDVVSPYSLLGFLSSTTYEKIWKADQVSFEFIPFFLGGVMQASENQPPGLNRFKANYMIQDLKRNSNFFKLSFPLFLPDEFPGNSMLVQRILTALYLDRDERLKQISIEFWKLYWGSNQSLSDINIVTTALQKIFNSSEVKSILMKAQSNQVKEALKRQTEDAVRTGAFGAPWFVVEKNMNLPELSEKQVFFGSDRMESIAFFLGVKYFGPNPATSKL